MKKLIVTIFLATMISMVMLCILTPDKTNDGEYTNPFRYWTDNQYFMENFK